MHNLYSINVCGGERGGVGSRNCKIQRESVKKE